MGTALRLVAETLPLVPHAHGTTRAENITTGTTPLCNHWYHFCYDFELLIVYGCECLGYRGTGEAQIRGALT